MKTKLLLASLFVVAIVATPKVMAQEFAGDYQNDYSHDAADEMAMRSAQYASQFCSANVNPQMMQQPIYEQAQMQQVPPAQAFEINATANNYPQNLQPMQNMQSQPGVSEWQTQVPQESMQGQMQAQPAQYAPGSPEQQAMFDATLEAANRQAYHNGSNNNGSKKFRGAMSSVGSAVGSVMKSGMGVAVPTGTAIGTYFIMKAAFGPLANPYMMTLPMTQALMMRAIMH